MRAKRIGKGVYVYRGFRVARDYHARRDQQWVVRTVVDGEAGEVLARVASMTIAKADVDVRADETEDAAEAAPPGSTTSRSAQNRTKDGSKGRRVLSIRFASDEDAAAVRALGTPAIRRMLLEAAGRPVEEGEGAEAGRRMRAGEKDPWRRQTTDSPDVSN